MAASTQPHHALTVRAGRTAICRLIAAAVVVGGLVGIGQYLPIPIVLALGVVPAGTMVALWLLTDPRG